MNHAWRRKRSRSWRSALIAIIFLLWGILRIAWDPSPPDNTDHPPAELREGECQVVRVVDGDTLIVRQFAHGEQDDQAAPTARLRLLGIDTPESVTPNRPVEPWGREASDHLRQLVAGRTVHLQFDRRRVDRYNRWLAYVFVDDRFVNEAMIQAGLARVMVLAGDSQSMARRLRRAEQEARRQRLGIWSE